MFLDGTGTMPYAGSVLVQGNRIRTIGRSSAALAPNGATVIDGAGATLMPGMCEAHTHFSWNDAATLAGIQTMPLEEHVLWCAKIAKRYLEAGWTSCVGAACAKPRLNVVTRSAISSGQIPARATSRRARRSPCQAASATRRCRTCRSPSSASVSTSTPPTR
jgi:imidazolonepropionase-like amidohydrolase